VLRWRFILRHPKLSKLSQFSIAEALPILGLRSALIRIASPQSGKVAAMAAPRLVTYEHLKSKGIGLSKHQIWRLEEAGKFPRRVSTSPRRHAWVESEIDRYIKQKIAARDAGGEA
jgi:prophage regulatory protein